MPSSRPALLRSALPVMAALIALMGLPASVAEASSSITGGSTRRNVKIRSDRSNGGKISRMT